jgi:AraC-like DNA-binding protein
MILVNEYIYLDITQQADIESSFCTSTQNENYFLVTFRLFANDCLFDLADKNYIINIRIAKNYFEKYNETFEIKVEKQSICCNTQTKLLDLINCKLTGINKKIFLESTILFLLYQTQKNSLLFQLSCDACAVFSKPTDIQKMHLAKNYIVDNLTESLTIPKISTIIGTNQCYLKKGFKEVFNQTIFEFVQENRMIKAKYLLENTTSNITEIAFAVGYSSLSSFSQAYKNYFGITPLEQSKAIIPNN